jgi:lysozyme family protein
MKRMATMVLGALLAVALSACGDDAASDAPAAAAPVSTGQVQTIAENLLAAYNSGDYQAFSRDLSLPAKLIVDAETFADFRYQNLPVTGPYLAITSVQAAPGRQDADHASYLVHARFEHQNAVSLLVTVSRGGEVEGLELYPRDQ